MKGLFKFSVSLSLPEPLQPLLDLAYNLRWTWTPEAGALFERIDSELWEQTRHNPIEMMGYITLERFEQLMADEDFMRHLGRAKDDLDAYLTRPSWCAEKGLAPEGMTVAYFSAEFGLHECVPLYSGGLGILSGDHLKSASDLGAPLIGVGLFYRHGYFSQYLSADGWQMETYSTNDFFNMAAEMVKGPEGKPLLISVQFPGREVWARIWRIQVGRVPLFLLDSDVDRNSERDRAITNHLYGGGLETRIEQEILLGIGGIRALWAMNRPPAVCHINEGHSAFLGLERIRRLVKEKNMPFEVARELITQSNLFTTHTPVPAGIDKFPPDMVRGYFQSYAEDLGITIDELIRLGQENPDNPADLFNMAVLALRLSAYANGVSQLHGRVSRRMWATLWPEVPEPEVPILHISNGIHTPTWLSTEFAELYANYLGANWLERPADRQIWQKVRDIPNRELWDAHGKQKRKLVQFARRRLKEQLGRSGAHPREFVAVDEVLDPEALTIGFARRFAAYKRATLLFRDLDRLKQIVNRPGMPVQFVFGGKAHPRDNQGKELIRQIIQISRRPEFHKRIVFIQDYDILVARYLVQGVDVWLNTPRRPHEASGTSGMKSSANGVLNLSVLDGWWCEGYNGKNGWVIGEGEEYDNHEYQDSVESHALYDLLEKTIVPLYYDRNNSGFPKTWTDMMKESIRTICPYFNTNRMVEQYTEDFYEPCFRQNRKLIEDDYALARELWSWRSRVTSAWEKITVRGVEAVLNGGVRIGDSLPVRARIFLGSLSPEDLEVEAYHGRLDEIGNLIETKVVALQYRRKSGDGEALYEGLIPCESTGERGFSIRILPRHEDLPHLFYSGLIKWWEG